MSVISANKSRDHEGAQFALEVERQECLHDEVGEALESAFDEWQACKGVPPNAYHAGHDANLGFADVAFIFEKVSRALNR